MDSITWLRRYLDDGWWSSRVNWVDGWTVATDKKSLVAVVHGQPDDWPEPDGTEWAIEAHRKLRPFLRAEIDNPDWCRLGDLLRFCECVRKEPCDYCYRDHEQLYGEWVQRHGPSGPWAPTPRLQHFFTCADCWITNGWAIPATPIDARKAHVGGELVCLDRLAWSLAPELVDVTGIDTLVRFGSVEINGKPLVVVELPGVWRVAVAHVKLTVSGFATRPPRFYPQGEFAAMWASRQDDPVACVALADWLEERGDPYAEELRELVQN